MVIGHALVNHFSHASDYILEQHGFRQTQTAITTYWFLRDGFRLGYLTPILGAPWSVPFEFPLFQLLTAYVVKLTGSSIDTAGRAVSFFFFLASLWPIYLIGRWLRMPRTFFPIAAILYCCAPLYLFWGRTFMIESLALFLALLFMAFAIRILDSDNAPTLVLFAGLCLTGTLAILVKVTTIAAMFLLVSILLGADLCRRWRRGELLNVKMLAQGPALPILIALLLAGLSFIVWSRYVDAIKATSHLTQWLGSSQLTTWNFGAMSDRIGSELWLHTVAGRAIPESVGAGGMLVLGAVFATRLMCRQWVALGVFLALFLGPFLIFPRLHIIHNYYQYANAIYLLMGAAVVLAALTEERPVWALVLVLMVAIVQLKGFAEGYEVAQGVVRTSADSRNLELGFALKNRVGREAAFLGFGLDWSSEVPYYSERRAILVRAVPSDMELVAGNPYRFLGGLPLEAVVVCPTAGQSVAFLSALSELTKGGRKDTVAGCDLYSNIRR